MKYNISKYTNFMYWKIKCILEMKPLSIIPNIGFVIF